MERSPSSYLPGAGSSRYAAICVSNAKPSGLIPARASRTASVLASCATFGVFGSSSIARNAPGSLTHVASSPPSATAIPSESSVHASATRPPPSPNSGSVTARTVTAGAGCAGFNSGRRSVMRSSSVLNCSVVKSRRSSGSSQSPIWMSRGSISISRSSTRRASRLFRRICSLCSSSAGRSFCARFGRSSRCSNRSSIEPNCWISCAAVFSPTPGTPGRLSDGSPRSAA